MAYSWETSTSQGSGAGTQTTSPPRTTRYSWQDRGYITTRPQPKQPGVISSFVSGVRQGFSSEFFGSKQKEAPSLLQAPSVFTDSLVDTFKATLKDTYSRFKEVGESYVSQDSDVKFVAEAGEAGLGVVNLLFAPISSGMQALATVPGLGMPAVLVNSIFMGVGQGSSDAAVAALNRSSLSEETKSTLAPLVGETASLVGMFGLGKGSQVAYKKIRKNVETTIDLIAEDPGLQKSISEPQRQPTAPRSEQPLQPPIAETPPGTFQSKTALRLRQEFIEKGVDLEVPIREVHRQRPAREAADRFVNERPERALELVEKNRSDGLPANTNLADIYSALRIKASAEGDITLAQRLARVDLPTAIGQGMKSLDRPTDLSVDLTNALKAVREARQTDAQIKTKGVDIKKAVQTEKNKVQPIKAPDVKTWQEFIKSIEC